MYDILIKNGKIIDGTGQAGFLADVAIKEDKIVKIGELHNEKGEIEIDANGKIVCPGFVDINNHSDTFWQIFLNPDLESLAYQGITTIVGGACGSSLAPLATPSAIESIQKWVELKNISFSWLTLQEFFDFLENKKFSVNFATLIGHENLRRGILKDELRAPNPKELRFIEKMLKDSMKAGALGISSGLIYTHARLATGEELLSLASIVKKYGGVYVTHIRDEAQEVVQSIEEAVKIGREAKMKLHISHLKVMGKKNWAKMDEALAYISRAREAGIDISFDVYPYTSTGSVLYAMFPSWVAEGGRKIMLHRLKDPIIRAKVITEMKKSGFEYKKIEIAASPLNKTLARRKITEIADSQNKSVEEAIIDVLIASEGRVITSMETLSEDNIRKAIIHPFSMIASNGAGYNLNHAKTGELVHPRSFGTFIKVLEKYVNQEKIITMEEAIRKMTAFPAEKFGIAKRGKLEKGYFADILVLDKNKIASPADKDRPYQYSRGIDYSFVNGKMVIQDGKYDGARDGRIIKRL
ncbi:MAG TPA: amidohydrolase family protein [Candidatus Moranbacteria bacterium]|nr:amidohydrolase family protein [Candidatus Moranbacteria bacterium]